MSNTFKKVSQITFDLFMKKKERDKFAMFAIMHAITMFDLSL